MVDLEDGAAGEFGHPPGPAVQAGADDHNLLGGPGSDRIVDRHGPRYDHFGTGSHHLDLEPEPPVRRHITGANPLHRSQFSPAEHRRRTGIGEPADGDAPIADRPALTHHHGGPAGTSGSVHAVILPQR